MSAIAYSLLAGDWFQIGYGAEWNYKNKKKEPENLLILRLLTSVGITGLEPATSRPPEATQLALNPVENQRFLLSLFRSVDVLVYFSPPFD